MVNDLMLINGLFSWISINGGFPYGLWGFFKKPKGLGDFFRGFYYPTSIGDYNHPRTGNPDTWMISGGSINGGTPSSCRMVGSRRV